ncbi:amino acid/polyamine transporter I [Aspergillus pseudotamarii]|uniref:Amino acid/polyamine transporter I n=1 Tax=Aspergillus pseudotamarii TaxID=132259 RepID=A0A5N6T3W4_ASPPS|nr:amino acid/polyamine transporter I [Aspergillus pseudotamarii]KAE8140996.1 amino acid/polyamine transporter I [Aspergillus pseudotamarii]
MYRSTDTSASGVKAPVSRESAVIQVQDADELRLAQMGHKQELKRHFSVWSLIGLAANCTISWTGLGLGLITSINAGGPGALIYGFILVFILQCFLGTSLAEFVSAYPVEGGMYHWIAAIAPKRYNSLLSFLTGCSTVFGWIFTAASTNLVYASNFMALIALYHDDIKLQPWMTFVAYQVLNVLTSAVVMFGNRFIPTINKFALVYLQLAWFVITVTVAATAPTHNDSKFVFRTWMNKTGWDSNVICFITGLVNPLFALGGLDAYNRGDAKPRAQCTFSPRYGLSILSPARRRELTQFTATACTLIIAFITGLSYLLSLMFSVQDWSSLADSPTGLPLAAIFGQATQSRGGAFALTFLLWIALGPCMIGSQLSTGRMLWAFARDDGLPFSKVWARVSPRFGVPLNAQICVAVIVSLLGCIYLGSSTAFNSMLSSATTINNLAYFVPIFTNVVLNRSTMHRGPFRLPHIAGMTVNIVTVIWLVFAIVFFSFPFYMPVKASNMNYTCVCVGGFIIIELMWWLIAGRRYSKTVQKAREEENNVTVRVDSKNL